MSHGEEAADRCTTSPLPLAGGGRGGRAKGVPRTHTCPSRQGEQSPLDRTRAESRRETPAAAPRIPLTRSRPSSVRLVSSAALSARSRSIQSEHPVKPRWPIAPSGPAFPSSAPALESFGRGEIEAEAARGPFRRIEGCEFAQHRVQAEPLVAVSSARMAAPKRAIARAVPKSPACPATPPIA